MIQLNDYRQNSVHPVPTPSPNISERVQTVEDRDEDNIETNQTIEINQPRKLVRNKYIMKT